jgi:hypothetical protein
MRAKRPGRTGIGAKRPGANGNRGETTQAVRGRNDPVPPEFIHTMCHTSVLKETEYNDDLESSQLTVHFAKYQ